MGLAQYFSEEICLRCKTYSPKIISFVAGISITYLFLDLFPTFAEGALGLTRLLFFSVVFGFAVFYIIEKYIYKHYSKNQLRKELAIEESFASFIYHFVIGMVIVTFVDRGIFPAILFFAPPLFYTSISSFVSHHSKYKSIKILLSTSTLLGILFVLFVYPNLPPIIKFSLLGFVIGVLSYEIIRHSVPGGKKGEPIFFILGATIYSLLITFMWVIV